MRAQCEKTLSVPEAGRVYFDLGKNASYNAAKRGEIPVLKIGGRLRVPVVALERMLDEAGMPKTQATSSVPDATVGRGWRHLPPEPSLAEADVPRPSQIRSRDEHPHALTTDIQPDQDHAVATHERRRQ